MGDVGGCLAHPLILQMRPLKLRDMTCFSQGQQAYAKNDETDFPCFPSRAKTGRFVVNSIQSTKIEN